MANHKKKADISCWSSNHGQFLSRGECFEEELLKKFQSCSEMNFYKNDKLFMILYKHLKTEKGKQHDQDILDTIFREKISIDYEFAEKLNLFDIVDAECFNADGELGDAILQLCVMADMRFIVSRKFYTGKETVKIDFEVCHCDSDYDCHKALITQTFKS